MLALRVADVSGLSLAAASHSQQLLPAAGLQQRLAVPGRRGWLPPHDNPAAHDRMTRPLEPVSTVSAAPQRVSAVCRLPNGRRQRRRRQPAAGRLPEQPPRTGAPTAWRPPSSRCSPAWWTMSLLAKRGQDLGDVHRVWTACCARRSLGGAAGACGQAKAANHQDILKVSVVPAWCSCRPGRSWAPACSGPAGRGPALGPASI